MDSNSKRIGLKRIMNVEIRRPTEEPYAGKLLVRFREGPGRRLPGLLDKFYMGGYLNTLFFSYRRSSFQMQ